MNKWKLNYKKKTVRLTSFLERRKKKVNKCYISVPSLSVIYLCYLNLVKNVQRGYFYFSTKLVASSHRLKLTTFIKRLLAWLMKLTRWKLWQVIKMVIIFNILRYLPTFRIYLYLPNFTIVKHSCLNTNISCLGTFVFV